MTTDVTVDPRRPSAVPPPPRPPFHWTVEAWGYALRCQPLSAIAQHAFTTKQLQLHGGGPAKYPREWTLATAAVGAELDHLTLVRQIHEATVRVLKQGNTTVADIVTRPAADAIASDVLGLVLAVQVADCVPILIADRAGRVAAAVHAGWRGTCAGIARVAVERIAIEFACHPSDLIAAIGPSIGPCCYQVGEGVRDAFASAGWKNVPKWFFQDTADSLHLDLWAANRDQLSAAGLTADRIYVSGLCTKTHLDVFESYRVDGERAGRMAALIRVP
jgi:purine-nucleoside/S-methyl-5'-thioadenosine phosphorylase / adenosine deaminase